MNIKKSIALLATVGALCCFGSANAMNPLHVHVIDHADGTTSVHQHGIDDGVGYLGPIHHRTIVTTAPTREVVVYRHGGRCYHGVDRNPINNRSRGSMVCDRI